MFLADGWHSTIFYIKIHYVVCFFIKIISLSLIMFGFYTLDRPSGPISNSGQELHFGFLAMHWYRPQNIIR